MRYEELSTPEILEKFNEVFDKNVKKGSYPRKRMIEELQVAAPLTGSSCPNGCDAPQEPAGTKGTFLGDSALVCGSCNTAYNRFTFQPLAIGKPKKRRVINPQHKINAKEEDLKRIGVELIYDRGTRSWSFRDATNGKELESMKSPQFASLSSKELVLRLQRKLK